MIRATERRRATVLVLEDGRMFRGESYGATETADGETVAFGEAVFATGMTGYQETLTDPSYARQVVVQTAPHIGNTGVNDEDPESRAGSGWPATSSGTRAGPPSNWRSRRTLAGRGAARAGRRRPVSASTPAPSPGTCASAARCAARSRRLRRTRASCPRAARARTREPARRWSARTWRRAVSTPEPYTVSPDGPGPASGWPRSTSASRPVPRPAWPARGIEVTVFPATTSRAELLADAPDGVFLSNGPGDPATCDYAVDAARAVLDAGTPLFGICFGNQVLGRALGFGTYKLAYGHRGINQPVQDRATGSVAVTSHNHGFAVDAPLDARASTRVRRRRGQPRRAERRGGRGPAPARRGPPSRCSTTRRRPPARTTPTACSTPSSTSWRRTE